MGMTSSIKSRSPICLLFAAFLAGPAVSTAQETPHWGVQGDYYWGKVPNFVIDRIDDFSERPTVNSNGYNLGAVRFKANGAPSWSVDFSRIRLDMSGQVDTSSGLQQVAGAGNMRGVMATKFVNFFSRRYFSGGLAFGGGVGTIEGHYIRYRMPPGPSIITDSDSIDRVVPMFQIVAQADVRPIRWLSVSPFYGIRNGTLGGGAALRIHFTK